jgi:hypothetical protein
MSAPKISPRDLKVPGPPAPALAPLGLQQRVLAHQALAALAVDRAPGSPRRDRGDHPCAVGRVLVLARDGQDDPVKRIQRPPLPVRRATRVPIGCLTADPGHARDDGGGTALRDQLAGSGDAHAYSQPRKSSPATSSCAPTRARAG